MPITEKRKIYLKTEAGKKNSILNRWQFNKIKLFNKTILYDRYKNTEKCELCDIDLICNGVSKNKKSVDHDHLSGYFRFICCNTCNSKLRKVDNNKMKLLLEIHRYSNR